MPIKDYDINDRYKKNITYIMFLVLGCFPFIQLGINYYLSIQILAFILILFFIIPIKTFISMIPVGFVIISLMFLPVIFSVNSNYIEHDILKTAREFVCYAPLYCIVKYRNSITNHFKVNNSLRLMLPVLLFSFLIITVIQYIYLKKGVYLSIPYEFFTRNSDTLPEWLDLRYSHIRPAATFGEPSYLSFVVTSLLVIVLRSFKNSWLKNTLLACIILIVYFNQSVSGQAAVFILLFVHLFQSKTKTITKLSLIFVAFLFVLLASAAKFTTVERLSNVFDKKKETSGYVRLTAPALVVSQVLLHSPIGVTNSQLEKFITPESSLSKKELTGSLSNGFYNLLINYGYSGFLLIILLLLPVWKDWLIVFYILLTTIFNGAFLSFDKVSVIVGTLYFVFYFSAKKNV
jgi:hypothetical protein